MDGSNRGVKVDEVAISLFDLALVRIQYYSNGRSRGVRSYLADLAQALTWARLAFVFN
ncbi:hypothetical protein [Sporomusa malonica]|uniref:hypothetical protein n=1 Tax=Sporomusa malonica TaxID=112901 RepID=UPI00159335CC|nr:hypothetical protein [Sporomusa malonica]